MKTLIFVNGPMGVGKSAVCRNLLQLLEPSVYLDGDWCWNMNPFQVTDETRAMVLDNISAVLSRFLACPELDYIIFGWVMHQPEIAQGILTRLDLDDAGVQQYTLLCSEATLRRRMEQDIRAGQRTVDVLERSLSYLSLYTAQSTVKIMTDHMCPKQIAQRIAEQSKEGKPHSS